MSDLAKKLAGLAAFADGVNRQARATRYKFNTRPRTELAVLRAWLEAVGATRRDTIYLALLEHLGERQVREAKGKAAARRRRRETQG